LNLTQNIYFSFSSATKVLVFCYVLAQYVTVTTNFLQNNENLALHVTMVVNARC